MNFINEEMPVNYDEFKSQYWVADWCDRLEEFKKGLPKDCVIVRSGTLKEGDYLYCMTDGWEVEPITPNEPDEYRHYKDSPVGFWKCVARRIINN